MKQVAFQPKLRSLCYNTIFYDEHWADAINRSPTGHPGNTPVVDIMSFTCSFSLLHNFYSFKWHLKFFESESFILENLPDSWFSLCLTSSIPHLPFSAWCNFCKISTQYFFKCHHGDHSWNALQHIWNCKHCLEWERSAVSGAWTCKNFWMPGRCDLSQQESHLGYYTVCFV